MKKNTPLHDDEIDLIALFKIIWDGKIKILLISIILFLIGLGYSYQIPNNYLHSLTISKSYSSKFIKLDSIINLIKSNQSNQSNQSNHSNHSITSNEIILDRFIYELKDYEEFLFNLKNIKKFKEDIKNLSIEDQEKALFKYAKLLQIVKPKKKETNYTLNFKWHDTDEAKKIFQDTLNLVMNNMIKSIAEQLKQTLEFEKKMIFQKDRKKLDFLSEQSSIAKELDISDNQVDGANLYQSNLSLNINSNNITDTTYYLRGYKAIDKEIELIQNRDYQSLKFIEQEIDKFEKSEDKFVDYNVYLIQTKSLKNTKPILMISIILGLIIGVFYVLISNTFKSQTASNKNK
jgi:LPS O-antigen subunit length determinant protein (WzzB/FepE family)